MVTTPRARRWLLVAGIAALLALVIIGLRLFQARQEATRRGGAAASGPLLQPYELRLEVTAIGAVVGPEVEEIHFEQADGDQRVVWVTREAEPRRCVDAMVGREGVELAERLRSFALRIAGGVGGCTEDVGEGPVLYRVRWRASEQLTPATEGELALSAACLRALEPARHLIDQARAIHDRSGATAICNLVRGGLAWR